MNVNMKPGTNEDTTTSDTKPFTLQDVYRKLNQPKPDVLKWFQELGLIPTVMYCDHSNCTSAMNLVPSTCIDGFEWACCNNSEKHSKKRSIRRGTWFEGSRLAIEEIILLVYFWIHEFMQSQVKLELNITNSESVVAYYNHCREVSIDAIIQASQKIGGEDIVVEIIVSKFNRRKPIRGKKAEEWVYCGVELSKNNGRCFMEPSDVNSCKVFMHIVEKYVLPGTFIYSDSLKVYKETDTLGLEEMCVNQSVFLVENLSNVSTNNPPLESLWNVLKPTLPPYNRQREKAMLTGYIAEYLYRKIIKDEPDKFLKFITDISTLYEMTSD